MGILNIFNPDSKDNNNSSSLDQGLAKTKENLFKRISRAVAGKSRVDDEVLDELEEGLISADVGVETTLRIIERIQKRAAAEKYLNTAELNTILKTEILSLLAENSENSILNNSGEIPKPYVIMVVGVNGLEKLLLLANWHTCLRTRGKGYCWVLPIPSERQPLSEHHLG